MSNRVLNCIVGAAIFVAGSGLLVLTGCGEEEKPQNTRVGGVDSRTIKDDIALDKAGDEREERDLSPMELDTLRAMKARHQITREQYWNDKGGVLENEYVELWYPVGKLTVSHGMYTLDHIMKARGKVQRVFGKVPDNKLKVVCSANLQDYDKKVKREWWNYSNIDKDEITYQPIIILYQRGLVDIAVPREYFEWAIGKLAGGNSPRWMEEGLASILADERPVLENQLTEWPGENPKMDIEAIEAAIKKETDRKACRLAYYNCYRMVDKLIKTYGQDKVVQSVLLMGKGDSVDEAFEKAFNKSYKAVVTEALDFTVAK